MIHFSLADVADHGLLLGVRAMVVLTGEPAHAVAYIRKYPRFLKYDSDSRQKVEGTYETTYTTDMVGRGNAIALAATDGHMHQATIEIERRKRVRAVLQLDPHRDMSHDALTTVQAIQQRTHAQCSLAVARNLARSPTLSVTTLATYCAVPEYPEDIRTPDWPRVLTTLAKEGEVVKRGTWDAVPEGMYLDMRLAVSIRQSATHVVGLVRGDGAFRLYDNDSATKTAGTYEVCTPGRVREDRAGDGFFALILESSALSAALGPAITTQMTRAPARARTGLPPRRQPPQQRQRTE
jgi:hypothetical protein